MDDGDDDDFWLGFLLGSLLDSSGSSRRKYGCLISTVSAIVAVAIYFAISYLLSGCSILTEGTWDAKYVIADGGLDGDQEQDASLEQDAVADAQVGTTDAPAHPQDAGVDAIPACGDRTFDLGDLAAGDVTSTDELLGDYTEVCIEWHEVSISSRTLIIGATERCLPCDIAGVTSYCFPFEPGEIRIENRACETGCGAQTAMEDVIVEVRCGE